MTPMDAKTHEALKASIAKWERNAKAKTPRSYKTGPEDCPLCKLFFWKFCGGSPYQDAWEALSAWSRWPKDAESRTRAHAAARDEVAFLKSLSPEETP